MDALRLEEKQAWSGFLSAAPLFAGEEVACWHQGPEPPDVLCTTVSGRVVGIELTAWVDQKQIHSGKKREEFENCLFKRRCQRTGITPCQYRMDLALRQASQH